MRPGTAVLLAFLIVLLSIGAFVGLELASIPKLVPYKLLNLVGIVYGLLGLLVLSELVAPTERIKAFLVHWVAGGVLWASTVIPLGGLIGAAVGHELPSAGSAGKFFGTFLAYSLGVLTLLEVTVVNPEAKWLRFVATRHQFFGLVLLLSSAVAQLAAAFQDLYS